MPSVSDILINRAIIGERVDFALFIILTSISSHPAEAFFSFFNYIRHFIFIGREKVK